jgi:hypothetical protein
LVKASSCFRPFWIGNVSDSSHNRDTQHKKKNDPSLWKTQALRWDHILKIEITKNGNSSLHQQQFSTFDDDHFDQTV